MTQRNAETFKRLAAEVARKHEKSALDQFIRFLKEQGIIVGVSWDEVKAEGHDIDRYFRPAGGLTIAHFDALVEICQSSSELLAQAVVENMLRSRGLPAMATHWAADSLGSSYWEQVETPEDFERAAKDVELEYHRQREERQERREAAALARIIQAASNKQASVDV